MSQRHESAKGGKYITWAGGGLVAAILSLMIFDGIPAGVLVTLSVVVGALGTLLVWVDEL